MAARSVTSIILVTFGQLEYTRLCLDSIRARTAEPYELIVVDNGSTDGTAEFLRQCQDVKLIANSENRGFPQAANQGMLAAKGQNILLLNNDTVVTTGWLTHMLDALDSDPRIGLVGPCSNNVSGEQQISFCYQPVEKRGLAPSSNQNSAEIELLSMTLRSSILDHPSSTSPSACPPFSAGRYDRLEAVDAFAQAWARNHARQTVDTDRLVGFCLLIRREVIDRIGLLDERFGIGNFEDDDFCRRALHAGYRSVIAVDAFLHHFGGRTFLASGIDFAALMTENRQKFEEKWNDNAPFSEGATGRVAPHNPSANDVPAHPRGPILFESVPVRGSPDSNSRFQITFSPTGGLLLRPNPVKLSLCMIVRDNETTIGPALESIRPWVDEIIVVDTGSTDKTPEICLRYGAQLFEFPWCDDFSAARNESLKHARGEWIFWMDSDDTISVDCGSKLRQLAGGPHDDAVLGYIMQVHCPGFAEEGGHDVTVVDHVKLIRNRPDLRFDGRIHEQLLPAIRQAQGEVAWTDIYVVHSGSDHAPAGWQRKLERDLRILHKELDERPDHPFVLFNLGMTYADDRRYQRAVDYLQRCLEVSRPDESHQRKAYALLASSLGQAGRHDEAWAACQQGLALYPEDKELLFRSAMLHHHFGRLTAGVRRTLRFLSG